ncbi:keratin, type I cytoskeletal 10-like [Drosophila guanche]|uniref:Uncharacterized protein n=1 Tax=Drosophila guanche TaxID=7266 RepID=A0A3B0KPU2_DROGU|nr:keratin, type I cytoskeletal 10-like [Drosophila guanche]SPP87856.1 Hypothetical predicted protein [Drosophila guanche]
MRSFPCLVVAAALLAICVREALAAEQPQPLLDEGGDVDVDASLERVRRQVGIVAIGLGGSGGRRGGGGGGGRFDGPFRNNYRGGPYGGPFNGGPFYGGGPFGNPYQGRRYAGRFGGDFYGR